MANEIGIPSVDLSLFTSGDESQRAQFVKELGSAYENVGFVAVKNHGIDQDLINELYKQVEAFFNLPEEAKLKYEIPGIAGQRGYVSFGKEHAKNQSAGDLKEFWHFGQYVDDNDPIEKEYPENVTVTEG